VKVVGCVYRKQVIVANFKIAMVSRAGDNVGDLVGAAKTAKN
jgi:hypothetical protein